MPRKRSALQQAKDAAADVAKTTALEAFAAMARESGAELIIEAGQRAEDKLEKDRMLREKGPSNPIRRRRSL